MAVGGGSRSGRAAEPFPSAVGQAGPQGDPTRPGSHPCVPWPRLSLEQRGLPLLQLWSLVPEPFCQARVRSAELLECLLVRLKTVNYTIQINLT